MAYFDQYDENDPQAQGLGIRRTLSPWLSMLGGGMGTIAPSSGEAAPAQSYAPAYQFGAQPPPVAPYDFGDGGEPDPSAESQQFANQLGQGVLSEAKQGAQAGLASVTNKAGRKKRGPTDTGGTGNMSDLGGNAGFEGF